MSMPASTRGSHVLKAHDTIFNDLVSQRRTSCPPRTSSTAIPTAGAARSPSSSAPPSSGSASVDAIKDDAVAACDDIYWKPEWGKERMISMIRERSDWCISRQRTWGVPIPMFFCEDCGKPLLHRRDPSPRWRTSSAQEGSNAWWAKSAEELMPEGAKLRMRLHQLPQGEGHSGRLV